MKLTKTQQAEYNRLKRGPQKGWFTFLHHDGPVAELTHNLMERVYYIVNKKPQKEILIRLRHIWSVPSAAGKTYEDSRAAAWKIYLESCAAAKKIYEDARAATWKTYNDSCAAAWKIYDDSHAVAWKPLLALVKDCKWNGKTILE